MAGVALQRMVLICASLSMVTVHETLFRNQMLRNHAEISVRCRTGTRVFHTPFARQRTAFLMQSLTAISRFLTSDEATTAVEYAVMLALILMVVISAVNSVGGTTASRMSDNAAQVASATGGS